MHQPTAILTQLNISNDLDYVGVGQTDSLATRKQLAAVAKNDRCEVLIIGSTRISFLFRPSLRA